MTNMGVLFLTSVKIPESCQPSPSLEGPSEPPWLTLLYQQVLWPVRPSLGSAMGPTSPASGSCGYHTCNSANRKSKHLPSSSCVPGSVLGALCLSPHLVLPHLSEAATSMTVLLQLVKQTAEVRCKRTWQSWHPYPGSPAPVHSEALLLPPCRGMSSVRAGPFEDGVGRLVY